MLVGVSYKNVVYDNFQAILIQSPLRAIQCSREYRKFLESISTHFNCSFMQLKQQTSGHNNFCFLGVHILTFSQGAKCRMAMIHALLYHSAPRPEVLKHPSSAVITLCVVLKHPSSAVIAFYEGRQGDTISTTQILYPRTVFTSESCMGVQYSLGNLVRRYQIHHDTWESLTPGSL